jgi:hypothetical protein
MPAEFEGMGTRHQIDDLIRGHDGGRVSHHFDATTYVQPFLMAWMIGPDLNRSLSNER